MTRQEFGRQVGMPIAEVRNFLKTLRQFSRQTDPQKKENLLWKIQCKQRIYQFDVTWDNSTPIISQNGKVIQVQHDCST